MTCFATFTLLKGKNQTNPREFMILNKFSSLSLSGKLRIFVLQFFAIGIFSCNKTANINGNKAFVGLTHVAYGVGPLNVFFPNDGDSLMASRISFGNTSGISGYPYDTATSRISDMQLLGDTVLLSGNAAFQQGAYYSIFAYDSMDIKSIALLILQNNVVTPVDTVVNLRFLNFSPGSQIGLKLIYVRDIKITDSLTIFVRDTVNISPSLFVGYDPNPASYTFRYTAHIGENQVFAYSDSAIRSLGTIQFDSTKSYNLYLQGNFHSVSPQDSLQLKSILLN